ncbi:hypothetical protein F4825DRAFT_426864 [Nemania diffusa]|nr:hypothetical protein F4825DRAFT_426864 [Nemania diffusa]
MYLRGAGALIPDLTWRRASRAWCLRRMSVSWVWRSATLFVSYCGCIALRFATALRCAAGETGIRVFWRKKGAWRFYWLLGTFVLLRVVLSLSFR